MVIRAASGAGRRRIRADPGVDRAELVERSPSRSKYFEATPIPGTSTNARTPIAPTVLTRTYVEPRTPPVEPRTLAWSRLAAAARSAYPFFCPQMLRLSLRYRRS